MKFIYNKFVAGVNLQKNSTKPPKISQTKQYKFSESNVKILTKLEYSLYLGGKNKRQATERPLALLFWELLTKRKKTGIEEHLHTFCFKDEKNRIRIGYKPSNFRGVYSYSPATHSIGIAILSQTEIINTQDRKRKPEKHPYGLQMSKSYPGDSGILIFPTVVGELTVDVLKISKVNVNKDEKIKVVLYRREDFIDFIKHHNSHHNTALADKENERIKAHPMLISGTDREFKKQVEALRKEHPGLDIHIYISDETIGQLRYYTQGPSNLYASKLAIIQAVINEEEVTPVAYRTIDDPAPEKVKVPKSVGGEKYRNLLHCFQRTLEILGELASKVASSVMLFGAGAVEVLKEVREPGKAETALIRETKPAPPRTPDGHSANHTKKLVSSLFFNQKTE